MTRKDEWIRAKEKSLGIKNLPKKRRDELIQKTKEINAGVRGYLVTDEIEGYKQANQMLINERNYYRRRFTEMTEARKNAGKKAAPGVIDSILTWLDQITPPEKQTWTFYKKFHKGRPLIKRSQFQKYLKEIRPVIT
jgi:hypothetical protein